MRSPASELRIPAAPAYVVVAKRAAAGFGYVAGLDIEAVDDLCIAVAQACENAIRCAESAGALGSAQIRLTFSLDEGRLDVQVRSSCRVEEVTASATAPEARQVVATRQAALAARADAVEEAMARDAVARDLALRVMGLFVDDCRYRVDARTGGLKVRLTKYRIS